MIELFVLIKLSFRPSGEIYTRVTPLHRSLAIARDDKQKKLELNVRAFFALSINPKSKIRNLLGIYLSVLGVLLNKRAARSNFIAH